MWTRVIAKQMGVSGQIQDVLKAALTVLIDGWSIGCKKKKSQGLQTIKFLFFKKQLGR